MKLDNEEYKRGYEAGLTQGEYEPPKCNKENSKSIRDYNEGYEDGERSVFKSLLEDW
jgi:hypothetical protein